MSSPPVSTSPATPSSANTARLASIGGRTNGIIPAAVSALVYAAGRLTLSWPFSVVVVDMTRTNGVEDIASRLIRPEKFGTSTDGRAWQPLIDDTSISGIADAPSIASRARLDQSSCLRRELIRRVQRGDLVTLGKRWIVEHCLEEVVESSAEPDHCLPDV